MKRLGGIALFLLCVGFVFKSNWDYMESYKDYVEQQEQIILVPHIDAIRRLPLDPKTVVRSVLLGNEALLADILWVRAIHYLGGNYSTLSRPITRPDGTVVYKRTDFINLMETIHFLDPHFLAAYKFAAFVYQEFLARDDPSFYDRACDELEQGALIAERLGNTDAQWRYLWEASFIQSYYKKEKDYDRAFAYCERAMQVPGVPPWVERLCMAMRSQSGAEQRAAALAWFQQQLNDAIRRNDEIQRQVLEGHVNRILNEVNQKWLDEAWRMYLTVHGQPPQTIHELLQFGRRQNLPSELGSNYQVTQEDPRGGFYVVVNADESAAMLFGLSPGPQIISTYAHFQTIKSMLLIIQRVIEDFEAEHKRGPQSYAELESRLGEIPRDYLGLGEFTLLDGVPDFHYTTPQLSPEQREAAVQAIY